MPVKLRKGFVTYDTDGKQLMVAAGPAAKLFHGMVKSNTTAAFIVNCLKKDTTIDSIVSEMTSTYDVSEETARIDAEMIVGKLRSIGAIDE